MRSTDAPSSKPMRPAHMRRRQRRDGALGLVLLGCLAAVTASAARAELSLVTIVTGPRSGVYYSAGGRICAQLNAQRWQHGIRCITEKSSGSVENLQTMRIGAASFAIAQSDGQYDAVLGTGAFAAIGPDRTLRSVFAIYPEAFTVVAGRGSGITGLSDLKGKRISIGPPGSGSRVTVTAVMQAMGWEAEDFSEISGIDTAGVKDAICDGDIDAAVLTIAHPNLVVEEMLSSCGATLAPVEGDAIAELIAAHPYYFADTIRGGTYPDHAETVPTFALAATLVSSTRVAPSIVYELVRAVFEDIDAFQASHTAFADFSPEKMVDTGLTAPLHDGALRYFREVGLK